MYLPFWRSSETTIENTRGMPKDTAFSHLSSAYGKNHYSIDKPFQMMLRYFAGDNLNLESLGGYAGKELYEIAHYVDHFAEPKLVTWSIDAERVDEVWLAPSERGALDEILQGFKVNRSPYKPGGNWFEHYACIYLIADPGLACIVTLTNQTAYALFKYGSEEQKKSVPYLIGESSPQKFGATWFTEIQGGSDLGANKVEAVKSGNSWEINGDAKYFASDAGLADYALVTARVKDSPGGAKGLSLFLVPKVNSSGERNFRIRRLKDKGATRNVPTGEVEFKNSEASTIGEASKGIYYAMETLTVSRLANSMGALGLARKAYLEAYYYCQKRASFGKKLIEHPLIQKDLLEMEMCIEGTMALSLKAIHEFEQNWHQVPPYSQDYDYARVLTHIAKNLTGDMSAEVTKKAMELHGGIGFLSEFPIERLHRESLVTPIWEGGSNIQALDMLEALSKGASQVLLNDLSSYETRIKEKSEVFGMCRRTIEETLGLLTRSSKQIVEFYAKDYLGKLGHSLAAIILLDLGNSLHSERFLLGGELYFCKFVRQNGEYLSEQALSKVRRYISIDVED
jgi:acyl-CoA dehydrogenase